VCEREREREREGKREREREICLLSVVQRTWLIIRITWGNYSKYGFLGCRPTGSLMFF
jgi:hypothetical protein